MTGSMCLFILLVTSTASQQCSKAVRSIKGKYLTGHVISSGSADGLGDCLIKCAEESRCKSINFRFKNLFCELSDADRYTHPWDYGSREGHAYSDYPFKATFKEFYMTPIWLEAHASYIDGNRSATAEQITFNAGLMTNAALLKVPLVTAGVLADGTPLTVEITVANDVSIGRTSDSDIRYGVSDGTSFIGFETPDEYNYQTNYPCYGIEGMSGETLTNRTRLDHNIKFPPSARYPNQFVFTLKLDTGHGVRASLRTAKVSLRRQNTASDWRSAKVLLWRFIKAVKAKGLASNILRSRLGKLVTTNKHDDESNHIEVLLEV